MPDSLLTTVRQWMGLEPHAHRLAVVLSGGGARAAYQAGVLQYIGDSFKEAEISILTGVSAGAINAAHIGNYEGPLKENGRHLADSWTSLRTEDVFREESGFRMLINFFRSASGVATNGAADLRGLVDTSPLRQLLNRVLEADADGMLRGVQRRIEAEELRAVAILTTNYATGQTVTWAQGDQVNLWERAMRVSVEAQLTVEHIMASCALPMLFPAVQLENAWYGDGAIRLSAPLSPAINLGADRILVISTRHRRTRAEADRPATVGYPPAAQIIGIMMNAVFLDVLDQDSDNVRRINKLVRHLPRRKRHGMRPIDLVQIRPSVDLGRLAHDFESAVPGSFRFLTRGLGTDKTQSPDWLSLLLFEKEYLQELVSVGYRDGRQNHDRLARLFSGDS